MTRCTFLLCAILFALCGAPPCVWAKVDVSQKTASGIFSITYEESVWVDGAGTLDIAGRASRCDYELASGLRKWPSEDPIGESGGLNLYGYVLNNPMNLIDETGQNPVVAAVAIGAGVGAVYGATSGATVGAISGLLSGGGVGAIWSGFWKGGISGASGGAVAGGLTVLRVPAPISGAAGGAVSGFVGSVLNEDPWMCTKMKSKIIVGGMVGAAFGPLASGLGGVLKKQTEEGIAGIASGFAGTAAEAAIDLAAALSQKLQEMFKIRYSLP